MNRSFYARRAWLIMIVLVLLLPLVEWGRKKAFEQSNNNIHQWLPQHFVETDRYEEFRRVFGADDFALVSWVGCRLDDPQQRLETFAQHAEQSEWVKNVWTGPRLLDVLTDEPFNLSRKVALKRLQGTLIGPDHQTTCALITLSAAGDADRTAALAALKEIAHEQCGIEPEQLRLGGDTVINAAIDIESERAMQQWIVLSFAVALAIAWFCLRSIKLMAMIFVVAIYSSDLGTAAVYYTGGTMNLVLVVVPVLLYVLTLSAAVHLSNYYRDAIREGGPVGAPIRAVMVGWTPCALSALTTALGLISLCVSQILPVKDFGIYSALGIVLGLGLLFLALPSAMEKWPVFVRGVLWAARRFLALPSATEKRLLARASAPDESAAGARHPGLRRLAGLTIRHRRPVVGICLALLVFLAGGVAMIQTTIAPSRFFAPGSKWVQDSLWLQARLGPMIPIEVVVRFDKECPMGYVGRMELMRGIERKLHSLETEQLTEGKVRVLRPIEGTISPATFGPVLRKSMGSVERAVTDTLIRRNLDEYAETGYLHVDAEKELWRISARTHAFSGINHDQFLRSLEHEVDAFINERLRMELMPGQDVVFAPDTVQASYTGIVPLVYLAQRELLSGLFKSFCLAFVMIAVVMALLLRSFLAGIVAMLPNVFPAVVTFGTMGWTATLIDVGAMMTASVALGIAVDDTLHFLTWFRRALGQGLTRHEAIVDAFGRCAAAMTQTTLIAGLGLLVFWFSSFQPISQFGLLMFILLVAALLGDLVFLPALLATRLGKSFERTKLQSVGNRQEAG